MKMSVETLHCIELVQVDILQLLIEFLASEHKKYIAIAELMNDLKNKWDSTPLHCAVVNGHLHILQFFISDQKRDPNLPGRYDRTPLHYAAEFGHLHIVKYLTNKQGCSPSCLDDERDTPLHCAIYNGGAHGHCEVFCHKEKL